MDVQPNELLEDLDDAPAPADPATAAAPAFLVVCDEPETLAALEQAVRQEGYRCRSLRHSWKARRILETETLAAIIADQHLPKQTGLELLTEVRERWPSLARLLLVGGVHTELLKTPVTEWVADQMLEIPWREWELRNALRHAAEASRLRHAAAAAEAQLQAQAQQLQAQAAELQTQAAHLETQTTQLQAQAGELRELNAKLLATAGRPVETYPALQQEKLLIGRLLTAIDWTAPTAELLAALLNQVREGFQAAGAAIVLRAAGAAETVVAAGSGAWTNLRGRRRLWQQDLPGYLLQTEQPCLIPDRAADARFKDSTVCGDLPAVAGLALRAAGRVLGALWLGRSVPFPAEDGRRLAAVGRAIAPLIDQALQRDELQISLKRLTALTAAEPAPAAEVPLEPAAQVLLENFLQHLQVTAAILWQLDPKTQTLDPVLSVGFAVPPARQSVPVTAGLAGRALQAKDVLQMDYPHAGGENFRVGVAAPLSYRQRLLGAVELFHYEPLSLNPGWLEFLQLFLSQIAQTLYTQQLTAGLQRAVARLRTTNDTLLDTWAACLDRRAAVTENDRPYLVEMTLSLARALKVEEAELEHYRRGVVLHDIGKLILPDNLLFNDQPFSLAERQLMRQHPRFGQELLSTVDLLRPAVDIPYCHHEAWDGSGYPRQLKGKAIPLAARIFAVIDVWNALGSDRPYRRGWPEGKIIEYIRAQSGRQFDPEVAGMFIKLWEEGEFLGELVPANYSPNAHALAAKVWAMRDQAEETAEALDVGRIPPTD